MNDAILTEIDRIESLAANLTEGPWRKFEDGLDVHVVSPGDFEICQVHSFEADAAFIADSRQTVPKLSKSLRKALSAMQELTDSPSQQDRNACHFDALNAIREALTNSER